MRQVCFLTIILIFCMSCDTSDNRLRIKNNADYPVYYTYTQGDSLKDEDVINLLVNPNDPARSDSSVRDRIAPKSLKNVYLTNVRWEGIAKRAVNNRIYFFFFPRDTLAKYTWEEIMVGKKYTGKASYTIEELKRKNWIITYPVEVNAD